MSFLREPLVIDVSFPEQIDAALEGVRTGPAVFLLRAAEGEPFLGKTTLLRRRLMRLLRPRERVSKLLNLRALVRRIEYWPVASQLEMSLGLYEAAQRELPDRYRQFLKLRFPSFVRLVLGNAFPRTQISTRLGSPGDVFYGPFRTRAAAEEFEHAFLDLFQLRRCQEDLAPSPEHPGCMYGEMNMCLRPCQQVVGVEEYASEAGRVRDFLLTGGRHLLESAEHARERYSSELEFEEAARWHKRVERIADVLRLREEIACEIGGLNGVAVLPSAEEASVLLLYLIAGTWQPPLHFSVAPTTGRAVSIDHRLRDLAGDLAPVKLSSREREDHLAVFARWYFSTWRDGIWIPFESVERAPWRKIVSAISRTATAEPTKL